MKDDRACSPGAEFIRYTILSNGGSAAGKGNAIIFGPRWHIAYHFFVFPFSLNPIMC